MSTLIPDYLNIDFNTLVTRLRNQIKNSDTFRDIDYEGSNINILIELFAYIGELNTYYLNKLAKNQFPDTVDVYENMHRLATWMGYQPKGYISSSGYLTMTVTNIPDDVTSAKVPLWTEFKTSSLTDSNGNAISFTCVEETDGVKVGSTFTFTIPVKQGKPIKFDSSSTSYKGSDIIDNRLTLPLIKFSYDENVDDTTPSMIVYVNNEPSPWSRIGDFYDNVSGLTEEYDVYMLTYNKYGEYVIEFSPFRNIPGTDDTIEIWAIESIGSDGNIAANSEFSPQDATNTVEGFDLNVYLDDYTTITNESALNGGRDPETISEIRANAKAFAHTQYRLVTKYDYQTFLEEHQSVQKVLVWGEQEQNPSTGGNVWDYNNVYICFIPTGELSEWSSSLDTGFITQSTTWNMGEGSNESILSLIPSTAKFNSSITTSISTYLEPRKMLCTYETYVVPELVYFGFKIGIRVKRTHKYSEVKSAITDKLLYYFSPANRNFGETIKFTDIIYTMMDPTYYNESTGELFENTKGLLNVVIRDIKFFGVNASDADETWEWMFPYASDNENGLYPRFDSTDYYYADATPHLDELVNIKLGFKQFPILIEDHIFIEQIDY